MPPAIPEIIVIAEDETLFKVRQANFCLSEDSIRRRSHPLSGSPRHSADPQFEVLEMISRVEGSLDPNMPLLKKCNRWPGPTDARPAARSR